MFEKWTHVQRSRRRLRALPVINSSVFRRLPGRGVQARGLRWEPIMKSEDSGLLLLLGNSTLTREIQGALVRLGLQVKLVSTAQEALEALLERETDLLVVEITAVGHTGVGLADLAEAARERGTSLALLTSHSPLKNVACA